MPSPGPDLRLQILGPLRVRRADTELDAGPRQQAHLLGLLLARAGRPTSTSELVQLIWADQAPISALNVLHKYVGALRRLLEPGLAPREPGRYLQRNGNGYQFRPDPGMLDLAEFRGLTESARAHLAAGRPEAALRDHLQALQYWQGPAGSGLPERAGSVAVFAELDAELLEATTAAAELARSIGRPEQMLGPLHFAAALAPLHEPVLAGLVQTLTAAGHRSQALAVYRAARTRLAEDLGIDPGAALQAAFRQASVRTADGPAQLPPDLPVFAGRDAEIDALHDLAADLGAQDRTGPQIVAMDGLGGVGKSTLAIHFAHQVAHRFPDGQLHLDLRGNEDQGLTTSQALRALSAALGDQPAPEPAIGIDAQVGAYRSLTAGRRLLLVLDNVPDAGSVRRLLPSSAHCLVLVTSRRPLIGLAALDGAHLLRIDLPDPDSARALIARRLEAFPRRGRKDVEVLDEIIDLCGRLPLALALLAGRLGVHPHLSLDAVADELRDEATRLEVFADGRAAQDPRHAFAWSYRRLSAPAARLFRLMSVAFVPGIPAEACASLAARPLPLTRALLEELTEAALLTEDETGRYSSHVLVRAYARELFLSVEDDCERAQAELRLAQHYAHSSFHASSCLQKCPPPFAPTAISPGVVPERPSTPAAAMDWFERHHQVLCAALGPPVWQQALNLTPALRRGGRFQDWEDLMRRALSTAEDDRTGQVHALISLAGARCALGAGPEALDLLIRAQHLIGAEGPAAEKGILCYWFAVVHGALGQHRRALAASNQALAHYRAAGLTGARVSALVAHGRALIGLGALDQARAGLEEALRLARSTGQDTDEPEIRIALATGLIGSGDRSTATGQLSRALRAAIATKDQVMRFQAALLLGRTRLAESDVDGACAAWREACEAMHSSRPGAGGLRWMRDAVDELGGRLLGRSRFAPRDPVATG